MRTLPTFVVCTLIAPLALAEGSTSDSGTDTSDSGTDTDTSESSDGSESDEATDGDGLDDCGGDTCVDPPRSARIAWPINGSYVVSPFTVQVETSTYCHCDTCGCTSTSVEEFSLTVEGEVVGGGGPGDPDYGSVEVTLPIGTYQLVAHPVGGTPSSTITVTVTVDSPPDDDEEFYDETAFDEPPAQSDSTGCGCTTGGPGTPLAAGLVLLGLLALRRRD